jgi:hypothetical protein
MTRTGPRIEALIDDADYWRGAPVGEQPAPPYKEWQHFVVFGPSWLLVLNLSVDGGGAAKIIAIVMGDEWHGTVAQCRQPRFRPGRLDAEFDRAGIRWRGGRYEIWHRSEDVTLEAVLTPTSIPSLSHNISLGRDARVSWCLVPRLSASGWFEHRGRRVPFEARPAYHDHNWGHFAWGGDFSWEWGCAVADTAESPWTLIFARMNDRAHHRTTATSVFLVKDGAHFRYLRNAEARFETSVAAPSRPACRVPAAAAILLPDEDRDVPRSIRFEARRGDDRLDGEVTAAMRGQVLIPSENDLRRIVRLNEAYARVDLRGRCADEPVHFSGPALLEVVRG